MKIAIVYASAGSGHRTAAESVYERLKKQAGCQATLIDILVYVDAPFARVYSKGYFLLASHLQSLWFCLFCLARFGPVKNIVNAFSRSHAVRFLKLLEDERFDAVVVTHFFPADAVSFLRSAKKISSKLVTIITDFGVHPLWVYPECDSYIVASDFTADELKKMRVPPEKIKVFGIPVREKFVRKSAEHRKLEKILLVTGSFGLASIERVVRLIPGEIFLTVVCGNNQKLFKRLKPRENKKLIVLGFTDAMPELMEEADLMITKPGGASIAEALAVELPMIFVQGIPGQESINEKVLESYGAAVKTRGLKELAALISDFQSHPEKISSMRENIKKIRKPDATLKIGNYVCSSDSGPAG